MNQHPHPPHTPPPPRKNASAQRTAKMTLSFVGLVWLPQLPLLLLLLSEPSSSFSWTVYSTTTTAAAAARSWTLLPATRVAFSPASWSRSARQPTTTSRQKCFTQQQLPWKQRRQTAAWLVSSTTETASTTDDQLLDKEENQSNHHHNNNENNNNNNNNTLSQRLPEQGPDGIYQILNKEQHHAFLTQIAHDQLVVLKIYAPWCRACKGLEPKFQQLAKASVYDNLPILFAELSIAHNKPFVQSLGVLALPTIQLYVAGHLTDNFPCGPSKLPILKRKVAALINQHVDASTRQVKADYLSPAARTTTESVESATKTALAMTTTGTMTTTVNDTLTSAAAASKDSVVLDGSSAAADDDDDDDGSSKTAAMVVETPTTRPPSVPAESITFSSESSSKPVVIMTEDEKRKLRKKVPYLDDLSLADLDAVLARAKLLTFAPGTIVMREGRSGRTFYVVRNGEVEICQKVVYGDYINDPLLSTPTNYLGTVINRLGPWDYFGERALITGEPRAASIRATEATTVWALDKDDFPASSPLSGRTRNTLALDVVNEKYGVSWPDWYGTVAAQLTQEASRANQVRGSVNTPQVIRGVDTEEDLLIDYEDDDEEEDEEQKDANSIAASGKVSSDAPVHVPVGDAIFVLLNRFQMIRNVKRCFDYIVQTKARWGDEGIRARRSMLVNRLTSAQRSECMETFSLIDASGDGIITLMELKRVLQSVGEEQSDSELQEIIAKGHDEEEEDKEVVVPAAKKTMSNSGTRRSGSDNVITKQDFMGIWAEAEFYYLFRDIFASLDADDTGYVKAGDLDRVLCGVRDLITSTTGGTKERTNPKSIIDVDDADMLIDYEQFSRMLLGSALL